MYIMKGFSFRDIYNMPVYLRNFYVKQLNEQLTEEAEEMRKATQGTKR